jgi:hypothetical protein
MPPIEAMYEKCQKAVVSRCSNAKPKFLDDLVGPTKER